MGRANASRSVARGTRFCHILAACRTEAVHGTVYRQRDKAIFPIVGSGIVGRPASERSRKQSFPATVTALCVGALSDRPRARFIEQARAKVTRDFGFLSLICIAWVA